jgi:riboflavin biosynthesis pyrimidine reductase
VANFVQTIDGVVAIPDLDRSNAIVSGESEADRFVVGLLRACADVVLIGARTLLASPQSLWQPERVYPPAATAFAELRSQREQAEHPAVAIVTAGSSLDASHPVLAQNAVVLTTERAADDLRAAVPSTTEVVAVNDGDRVDLTLAVAALRERGHDMILSEAGPTVFAQLLEHRLVDELFLTVSPLVAGRGTKARFAIAEGTELLPDTTEPAELLSLRRSSDHLFLRYGFSVAARVGASAPR